MNFKKFIVKLGLLLGGWQGMAFGQNEAPQALLDLRDQWEAKVFHNDADTKHPNNIGARCKSKTTKLNLFPTPTEINTITKGYDNCSSSYDYFSNDGGGTYQVTSPFGDSILFSSLLCDSDPTRYSWVCDSVAASQAKDGRFYRTILALNTENPDTIFNSFSMDHTLGVLLYLLTENRIGHTKKAIQIADNYWLYIQNQYKSQTKTDLNPQKYRVCPHNNGYCNFGADLGTYIPLAAKAELALFKHVYRKIGADISTMSEFDENLVDSFEEGLWASCSIAPIIKSNYFQCHLAAVTDLILKRTHYFKVDTFKASGDLLPIFNNTSNPITIPVINKTITLSPLAARKNAFKNNQNNTFLRWVTVGSTPKNMLSTALKNDKASELVDQVQNICHVDQTTTPGQDFLWEQANDNITTKSPTGWDCIEMLSYIINNYETDSVNYSAQ